MAIAAKTDAQFQLIEEGFLRSVGRLDQTSSLVFDDRGIYYDATVPSQLEGLIAEPLTPEEQARAERLVQAWRSLRLSKYNSAPEYTADLPDTYVLVLDQVAGDLSVGYGMADSSSFDRMLCAALDEHPDATVIVKVHPDVFTRARKGYFDIDALVTNARIRIVAENCHPVRLIEHARAVYTVTSQVGFEALIWGKKVRCFGMPFYAGWGLTVDELAAPERRVSASLGQLVHAALVKYPRYVDPEQQMEGEVETLMQHIGLQRRMMFRFPREIHVLGFSRWKRPFVRRFLKGSDVKFVKYPSEIPKGSAVAIWGNNIPAGVSSSPTFLQIEDGFLRSSGLGADLIEPMSWVIDDLGIYYDVSRPSRLEEILQTTDFTDDILVRAGHFREELITAGVTKYNLGGDLWQRRKGEAKVILVPGQVENDASIRFGAPDVKTNLGLLTAVRAANPNAYVIYKPHPDVVAGLRRAGNNEDEVGQHCDEIVSGGDTVEMLAGVDEVHTMTSLLGFEALIRGLSVTCYGQPFYSGWGLTKDVLPVKRRTRRLELDELVAGALLLYPTYTSRVTKMFTSPEQAIVELVDWRRQGPSRMPLLRRGLRVVLRLWASSGLRRNA
ncbi:MAG: capsular polysaccharide biosynthesis protein [Oleispira sp.]|nr:capsular polysaccharide biosynthesis protein [Oleispira sp.]